jgi:hypothetical protein
MNREQVAMKNEEINHGVTRSFGQIFSSSSVFSVYSVVKIS